MSEFTRNDSRDAWMAAALRSRAEHSHPRSDCPHPERLWDAVLLQVPVDERLEIIDHVSECPTCAEAWSLAAELAPADEHSAQPQASTSGRLRAMYARRALAAAAILVAFGIAMMVFRSAAKPDAASIEPSPTAPQTAPRESPLPTSAPPAAQQTPNSFPAPTPVQPTSVPALRAALADEVAVRNLISAYEHLIGIRDLAKLRAVQPNITAVELEALQRAPREPGTNVSIEVRNVRVQGRTATATIGRRDTVVIQGERQPRTSTYELAFEKTAAGSWVVVSATPIKPLSPPVVESDESAIRRVIETYKTAIETKDLSLLLSIFPGIVGEEAAARLIRSFQQTESQQVTITIDDIRLNGNNAIVQISRRDVITVLGGGRRTMSMSSRQTLRFEKSPDGWIITSVGP